MKKLFLAIITLLATTNCFAYRYLFCVRQGVHVPECFTVEIAHPDFCGLGLTRSNIICDRLNKTTSDNNSTPESLSNLKKITYKNDSKSGKTTFYLNKQAIFEIPKTQVTISKELISQIEAAIKTKQPSSGIK